MGIELAARKYFHKHAKDVNLYEATVLVGILGGTTSFNPDRSPDAADLRARRVLNAMVAAGLATRSDVAEVLKRRSVPGHVIATWFRPGYFIDAALREARDLVPGTSGTIRLVVTMSPNEQYAAETIVAGVLAANRSRKVGQAAVVSMRLDGAVTALVGGADYGQSQFDRATDAIRAPGSAFKPFVYLTAIEDGFKPQSRLLDAPDANGWPRNYSGRYMGAVPLSFAIAHSLNAAAVGLAAQVGMPKVIATARKLGITTPLNGDLSVALGSGGVTLMELTAAYGPFANGGWRATPYLVSAIYSDSGFPLYQRPGGHLERVIAPKDVRTMGGLLRGVVTGGTGVAARDLSFWTAGKTGTSQDLRDAWFVGFTTQRVCGVWFGNDDLSPMADVTGGSLPAETWRQVQRAAWSSARPNG